jgi:UPF0755 protein
MTSPKSSLLGRITAGFLMVIFLAGLSLAYVWFSFTAWLNTPLAIPPQGFHYELSSGKSLSHLSQDLASQKILAHPRWLNWYARFYQKEKIHPGEYLLDASLTPVSLLEKLNKGDVVLHQVTFVEGWNFKQVIDALNAQPDIKHLLADKPDSKRLEILNLPIEHLEGWFFPDTYRFTRGTSDVEILTQAYNAMRKNLDELWANKSANLPYRNAYEALIMASIIEKETGHEGERDKVAGVFVRRLKIGMPLQTDPTVIYGMGDAYKGKITRDDLKRPTTYNTYTIQGLPPTPIAIPGKASLFAALNPDSGKSLYFVAKGDGTSEFSETLIDHQRAVVRYQLKRAADYRSTPK